MAIDHILFPKVIFDVPSGGVRFYIDEIQVQGRLQWISALDVAVFIAGDE
jgi:hypothetical protein